MFVKSLARDKYVAAITIGECCIKNSFTKEKQFMTNNPPHSSHSSRREFFLRAGQFAAAGFVAANFSRALPAFSQDASAQKPMQTITDDAVAKMRAAGATAKLTTLKLTDRISVISGSGGNIGVLTGPDGKIVIDSGFATSAPQLRTALAALGNEPLRVLINTHWHFDHTDGNEWMHNAGALIVAHQNTRARLSSPQDIAALGLHFDASPAAALPQQTMSEQADLYFNQESLALRYYPPAHTDSDILIHFERANVIHAGDIFFNTMYPMIDLSTRGNIAGMIAAADRTLSLADSRTRIIPGHGPMGDRAMLAEYRDMMVTVHDRVGKLRQAGKTAEEAVAAKPTADLDAQWGKGHIASDFFVKLVYDTL
jgi:glyoxylase-like metal-dependent hydrolase (beta-lactamase superfamily II)